MCVYRPLHGGTIGIVEQMGKVAKVQMDKEMVLWNG
jgi:hypothetical protein